MIRRITVLMFCVLSFLGLVTLGCSGSQMYTLPPESYHYLKDDRVLLTTRDTVSLRPVTTQESIEVMTRLTRTGVAGATVTHDSLVFEVGRLAGKASLHDIESVQYYGIFDTAVGLLTNEEIRAYANTNPQVVGVTFMGIGAAVALLLLEFLDPFESIDEELDNVAPSVVIVLGAGAGYLYGHNLGSSKMKEEAIENAQSKQSEENRRE